MGEPCIKTQERLGGLWITLNRPSVMNSISPELLLALNHALDTAERSRDLRAVVVTGAGRAFCAGVDLQHARLHMERGWAQTAELLEDVSRTFNRMASLPLPLIAAVNGLAMAGGLEMVLCCDLVIAARSARFGDAHANYGLLPGGGGSVRLPRRIGATRAKYLLFTGESVSAAEMMQAGLVNQVVDDDNISEATEALVEKIVSKSKTGLQRMKSLVDQGQEQPIASALHLEFLESEAHSHGADIREGLQAFAEKRSPRFTET